MKPLMTLLILLFIHSSLLGEVDLKEFSGVLVYDQGRVKPIDTLARSLLLRFNATSTLKREDFLQGRNLAEAQTQEKTKLKAIEWFSQVIFEPEKTKDYKVFKVNNPQVLNALDIVSKEKRFSFNEFGPSFNKMNQIAQTIWQKEKNIKERTGKDYKRNPFEKEFMRLYQNLNTYFVYTVSFQFTLPVDAFNITSSSLKEKLNLDLKRHVFSYLELMEKVDRLKEIFKPLQDKKQDNFTTEEMEIANLVARYSAYPKSFIDNPIDMLPSFSHSEEMWLSPWKILAFENSVNLVQNEIKLLQKMANDYLNNDQMAFDASVREFKALIHAKLEGNYNINKPKTELFYNQLDPFFMSKIFYGFAMILALFSLTAFDFKKWKRWFWGACLLLFIIYPFWPVREIAGVALVLLLLSFGKHWQGKLSLGLLGMGWFFNVLGIGLRMYINSRPPITNLFETFIFVSAVGVGLCFLIERYNKKGLGLLSGAFSGLALMLISGRFGSDGDTIQVMQAVLDSNFWLATHVVTINLGYAGVVISGVVAHFYIIQKLRKTSDKEELRNIIKMVYGTLAFGFIFVFVGTVLGGIWADQSWGRFWGWDPKENGALLIALWCAILFHSRIGGLIKETVFSAGAIIGIIVVMWAWFGINLLGVGLHSYGFIDGVFSRLVIYSFLQLAFVLGSLAIIIGREHPQH